MCNIKAMKIGIMQWRFKWYLRVLMFVLYKSIHVLMCENYLKSIKRKCEWICWEHLPRECKKDTTWQALGFLRSFSFFSPRIRPGFFWHGYFSVQKNDRVSGLGQTMTMNKGYYWYCMQDFFHKSDKTVTVCVLLLEYF